MHRTYGSKIGVFCLSAAAAIAALLLASAPASGSTISAVGTVEQVTGGVYDGWFKYSYTVTWDFSKGLSHLDLTLPAASLTGAIDFAFGLGAAGQSTGSSYHKGDTPIYSVLYDGAFEPRGDPSTSLTQPLLKWEPADGGSPGKVGVGQFWFYSDAAPITGTFEDVLAAKYGTSKIFGDLAGAYPSSAKPEPEPIPEPATMAYLLVGASLTWLARRRQRRTRRAAAAR
ncbi:MAG: PEP-CTERM sorting domain-containing protein [Planctomycetota bacterium]|nr:PEP-CTERM sorting domain-containing protein [Planctomycetota bacterium]